MPKALMGRGGWTEMKCPHCGGEINPAALLGSIKSAAKAKASRANAKLGGWPKGKKRGKRKTLRQPNDKLTDGGQEKL